MTTITNKEVFRTAKRLLNCCILLSFVAPFISVAVAQEVEANGTNSGAIFSPADYIELITPVTRRVTVNTYGLYAGNAHVSLALLEVPITVQKHFVITPSYQFVNVPPVGFSLLTNQTAYQSYHENQFRIAGTAVTSWHGLTLSDRNMYARRFTPTSEINRYRNRIYAGHPLSFGSYRVNPFIFDEVYHDFAPGNWLRRNWGVVAVDMPINRRLTFQPSYIRQDDQYFRSVNFLGLALIIRTDPLFGRERNRKYERTRAVLPEVPASPNSGESE
jgi:Protein of unknown function (DUF2490)